jgi:diguanylate cyclase (GGDEF)-like protein/PAS domain S-box-containing protein
MIEETIRVLLVEDDEDDYVLTRDLLTQIPGGAYMLDWVTSFDAALAAAGTGQHDVYLIDYRLGAYSGIDLLHALLSAGCRAPILLLTGQGDRVLDSAAMQAGAADYLVKGEITSDTLERALRHARDRAQMLALREALADAEAAQDRARASEQFALATLDALPGQIAILDDAGVILAVNAAWRRYGAIYGLAYPNALIGQNYINSCERAAAAGDALAEQAARGIGDVLSGQAQTFALEYPCHAPTEQRWFALEVAPYAEIGPGRVVVTHHDITARTLAQEDILRREQSFRLLFRDNPQPMWVYEVGTLRFLEVNDAAVDHYGYSHAEFLDLRITDIMLPKDVDRLIAGVSVDPLSPAAAAEWRHLCKDGRMIDVAITEHELEFEGHAAWLVVAIDITARLRAEEALRAVEERFQAQYRGFPLPTFTWRRVDDDWLFADCNTAADTLTGGTLRPSLGRPATEIFARLPDVLDMLGRCAREGAIVQWERTWRFPTHPDLRDIVETWVPVAPDLIMQHVEDVTARKRIEEQVAHMAHHDALTGLPNRWLFNERLERAVAALARQPSTLVVLLVDLNHFKEVNDTMGHQTGDALLCEVARRLRDTVRPSDTVARLGGDEFALLMPYTDEQGALLVAQRLGAALDGPLQLDGHVLAIEMSIGIAIAPTQAADVATLLRFADLAMYRAKAEGLGFAVYRAESDQRSPTQIDLAAELRQAIVGGQLRLHFQPIVTCRSATLSRVEALVRWHHPVYGLLSPDRFIHLAEQMGLMIELTLWTLEKAIEQGSAWHQQGMPLRVSVNISMATIEETQFLDLVTALLRRYELPVRYLTFELTESRRMTTPRETARVLMALRGIGVSISMDGFRTGFSWLSYLNQLPVDEIKIERSFFLKLVAADNHPLVAGILGLADALGCTVVVEGVETRRQWDWLVGLGCEAIQGFYVGTPMPAEALGPWLDASPWARPEPLAVDVAAPSRYPADLGNGHVKQRAAVAGKSRRRAPLVE